MFGQIAPQGQDSTLQGPRFIVSKKGAQSSNVKSQSKDRFWRIGEYSTLDRVSPTYIRISWASVAGFWGQSGADCTWRRDRAPSPGVIALSAECPFARSRRPSAPLMERTQCNRRKRLDDRPPWPCISLDLNRRASFVSFTFCAVATMVAAKYFIAAPPLSAKNIVALLRVVKVASGGPSRISIPGFPSGRSRRDACDDARGVAAQLFKVEARNGAVLDHDPAAHHENLEVGGAGPCDRAREGVVQSEIARA
jgi:hypothetical protein